MTTIQTINIGSYANDGSGDDLRTAFEKVNNNFTMLFGTSNVLSGVNLGNGVAVLSQKNPSTLNLEFKTFTSNDTSIVFNSTSNGIDLSAKTVLQNDANPTLGNNINLNNHYIYGGDTQTTVYGLDVPVANNLISALISSSNPTVDMGSINAPIGYPTFPRGYTIDFNGTGGTGFLNPVINDYDFGSLSVAGSLQVGGNFLTLGGNLVTSGGGITFTTSGTSNVTVPNSGTLATTTFTLNQFASTTSAQLAAVISDESGTGRLVFNTNPTLAGTVSIQSGGSISFSDGSTLSSAAGLGGSSSLINGSYTVSLDSSGILNLPVSLRFQDGTILSTTNGIIPAQGSSAGLFLTTNGSSISWGNPLGAGTIYAGTNATTNSTLSIYGNGSSGTATLTSNVTTGTTNIFAGVTGTINIGGITWAGANNSALIVNNGGLQFSSANSVAAAGTNQGTATQLYADNNFITSGTGGVVLPAAATGREVSVTNNSGASINVYPQGSHTIESGTGGTPTVLPNLATLVVMAKSGNNWWTMQPVYNSAGPVSITQSANGTVTWGIGTGALSVATASSTASSVGYLGLPVNSQSGSTYAVVVGDLGKVIYFSATCTATIPASLPVGSSIAFVAGTGATVTIAQASDSMYLGGTGTTGSRTLAAYGMATAIKMAATVWFINGTGLT